MNTTTRLGLKVIDTPAVDTVNQIRESINNHATILDAQYLESTYALRPSAASKGRIHRSTDTGEVAVDTGTVWEPIWGAPSLSRGVLDTGLVGQTRAGRTLAASDFTDCGDANLVALYGCNGLTDGSGNSLSLTNKGSVPFGVGVEGIAASAAVFAGSSAQALYRADTGGGDPLRIQYGSVGGWYKSAFRGGANYQALISKFRVTGNQRSYWLGADTNNLARFQISLDGTSSLIATGVSDINDDRWHFIVGVYDGGTVKIFVDGQLEGTTVATGATLFGGTAPLNIGAYDADGSTAAVNSSYGRADECFVSGSAQTTEQIRHLYGVALAHGGNAPRRASLRVTRMRKGAALANGDFPSNPVAAYNFSAGALTELNGGTVFAATGGVGQAPGPDGVAKSALSLQAGNYLQRTDAGLPATTTDRSFGIWFNTASLTNQNVMGWASNGARLTISSAGLLQSESGSGPDVITGPFVADGKWHQATVVETNSPADGLKRKLYLDGALVGSSTVLGSITGAGANGFRIGANAAGTSPLTGLVARPWVHSALLTWEQVQKIYMKSAAMLGASPKEAGEHVELLDATKIVVVGDTLEPQWLLDMEVSR